MQLSPKDLNLLITGGVFVAAILVAMVTYRIAKPIYPQTKAAIAWTVTCLLGLGGQLAYDWYNQTDTKGSTDDDGYNVYVFAIVLSMVAIVGIWMAGEAYKGEKKAIDSTAHWKKHGATTSHVFIPPDDPGLTVDIRRVPPPGPLHRL